MRTVPYLVFYTCAYHQVSYYLHVPNLLAYILYLPIKLGWFDDFRKLLRYTSGVAALLRSGSSSSRKFKRL